MAWKLEGSYFETCSCEVVCPCTASLALGADYDRCRVTFVFNIVDGEVEGVDVSGLKVAAVADSPKVMSDGNWRLGVFLDAAASDEQAAKLGAVSRGRAPSQRQDRRRRRLRGRGRGPVRGRVGRAGARGRDLPPGRLGADDREGDAIEHQRLRHRVRGQVSLLDVALRVGRVT
jgi:hypothetical protein